MAGATIPGARASYRKIRGRPSTIDKLPNECEEDIVWANSALDGRQMTQTEILAEFNRRIGAKGYPPISKGAFSRHSVEHAYARREMQADLGLIELAYEMFPDLANDTAALAREILKLRLLAASLAPDPNPKAINSFGLNAKRAAEMKIAEEDAQLRKNKAQRDDEEREAKMAERANELVESVAEPAAERAAQLATEAGLSAERVAAIRRGVLGLAG